MVTYILSESQFSIGLKIRKHIYLGKLSHEYFRFGLELGGISVRPPVGHIAVLVEEASLIIKSVRHLMSYDNAYSSVIYSIVSIWIEERRLENCCREADLICRRIIICIDSLRSHSPLTLVGRFAEFRQIVVHIPFASSTQIVIIRQSRIYRQGRIVLPFVRIAYLNDEIIKLLVSPNLGTVAHPVKRIYMLPKSFLQIGHESKHLLL